MKVEDSSGQAWRVTRRWVPWRRRLSARDADFAPEVPGGLGDDLFSAIIFVVFLVLAIPFVLLALLVAVELLLLLLLLPFAVLGRIVLGRHWHVELRRGFSPWWEVEAGDWRASGLKIHEVADLVRRGETPERTLGRHGQPSTTTEETDTP